MHAQSVVGRHHSLIRSADCFWVGRSICCGEANTADQIVAKKLHREGFATILRQLLELSVAPVQ